MVLNVMDQSSRVFSSELEHQKLVSLLNHTRRYKDAAEEKCHHRLDCKRRIARLEHTNTHTSNIQMAALSTRTQNCHRSVRKTQHGRCATSISVRYTELGGDSRC